MPDIAIKDLILNNKFTLSGQLSIFIIFISNLIWFLPLLKTGYILAGDDLMHWQQMLYLNEHPNQIFLADSPSFAAKYRPMFFSIFYLLFDYIHWNYTFFVLFNIGLNIVISYTLYLFIKKYSNSIIAVSLSVLYIVSRFALYGITQAIGGVFELLPLYILILILFKSFTYIETKKNMDLVWMFLLFSIMIFINERFASVLPFILLVVYYSDAKNKIFKLIFLILPIVVNIALKELVLPNMHFLTGTGGTNIDFQIWPKILFLGKGFLNILGFNVGPAYLMGISYAQNALYVKFLVFTQVISITLVVFFYFFDNKNKNIKLIFSLFILIFFLTLASSVTIRQEARWLYAPYMVFLVMLGIMIDKIDIKMIKTINYKYFILMLFSIATLVNSYYFSKNSDAIHFMGDRKTADSCYASTVKKYGDRLKKMDIYIGNNSRSRDYFTMLKLPQLYLNDFHLKVYRVENIKEIADRVKSKEISNMAIVDFNGLTFSAISPKLLENYSAITIDSMDIKSNPKLKIIQDKIKNKKANMYDYMAAGVIYLHAEKYKKAEYYLSKSIGDKNPYPYHYLGVVKQKLGHYDEAKIMYQLAIKYDNPKQPNPWFKKALDGLDKVKLK